MRTTCLCPLLTSSSGRVAVVKGEFLPLLGIGSWSSNSEVVTVLTDSSPQSSIPRYRNIWNLGTGATFTWHDWTRKWDNYLTRCFLKCSFHILFTVAKSLWAMTQQKSGTSRTPWKIQDVDRIVLKWFFSWGNVSWNKWHFLLVVLMNRHFP